MRIEFTLNNKAVKVDVPPEHRLLDVLRDEFGLRSLKEGSGEGENFKIIQEAFKKSGAVQCGFCTPGMVISAEALLREKTNPTMEDIRNAISGNLCRCTGYNMIIEGINTAVQKREEK